MGVPRGGYWREMINTNSDYYAGTGVGNDGGRTTDDLPSDGTRSRSSSRSRR